jgi:hypothetical protein
MVLQRQQSVTDVIQVTIMQAGRGGGEQGEGKVVNLLSSLRTGRTVTLGQREHSVSGDW